MQNQYDADYFWQGDKIRLRPSQPLDWETWYQEAGDTEGIRRFNLEVELPVTAEMVREQAEKYAHFQNMEHATIFAVETLEGELVGTITLHSRDEKNGRFSMGLRIYRPYRRRGYAEEAARILLRYGFYELRCQKANSACMEHNEGSIRLHEKLGFKVEGRRRRHIYTNGRYYDDILFGMTREEFDEEEEQRQTQSAGRED